MAGTTRDWVIDVDTHITEPGDLWTSRLPQRFQGRAPRLVRNPENQWDVWQVGDFTPIVPVGFTAVAGWKEPFPAAPRNMDEVPKASFDARARLEYMDSLAIWAMALYPNVGGFGSQGFLKLGDGGVQDGVGGAGAGRPRSLRLGGRGGGPLVGGGGRRSGLGAECLGSRQE